MLGGTSRNRGTALGGKGHGEGTKGQGTLDGSEKPNIEETRGGASKGAGRRHRGQQGRSRSNLCNRHKTVVRACVKCCWQPSGVETHQAGSRHGDQDGQRISADMRQHRAEEEKTNAARS